MLASRFCADVVSIICSVIVPTMANLPYPTFPSLYVYSPLLPPFIPLHIQAKGSEKQASGDGSWTGSGPSAVGCRQKIARKRNGDRHTISSWAPGPRT